LFVRGECKERKKRENKDIQIKKKIFDEYRKKRNRETVENKISE